MFRLVPSLAVALTSLCAAVPALAADYYGGGSMQDFRPAYEDESPLGFEAGLRYWYSLGENKASLEGHGDFNSTDKTQFLEGHLRIDDYSTGSYVKGLAGYSVVINGDYDTPFNTGDIVDGQIGYVGADFGYNPFGGTGTGSGVYGLVGYQYWNDSPNIGRQNFTTAKSAEDIGWSTGTGTWTVPGDSEQNDVNIHALRLGLSGKAEFSDQFDLSGEIALVPYAWVNGTLGAAGIKTQTNGPQTLMQSSAVAMDGFGYGAMGEVMAGFHPTENITFRLGGRAWYLQGQYDAKFDAATITDPVDSDNDGVYDVAPTYANQTYIIDSNPFSMFRYGALAELTFKF